MKGSKSKKSAPASIRPVSPLEEELLRLGADLEKSKRLTEALAVYQRMLAARPDFVPAKLNVGRVLILLRRSEEALRILEEARASP